MALAARIRKLLSAWFRQGKMFSQQVYYLGGIVYWLTFERRLYVGTRVVEIPQVLKWLSNHTHGGERILQVGDVLLKDALKRYEVELADLEAEEFSQPGLKVHRGDIREAPLPSCHFDVAISISTLEHIGMQKPYFPNGDKMAVDIIAEALKPGGLFFFSVPFGRPTSRTRYRVYDRARVKFIIEGRFEIQEEMFFVWRTLRWRQAFPSIAEEVSALKDNPRMNLGVCLVSARKRQ